MKKFLALLLVLLLVVSLAACKTGDTSSSQKDSTKPTVTSYTVAFEADGARFKSVYVIFPSNSP